MDASDKRINKQSKQNKVKLRKCIEVKPLFSKSVSQRDSEKNQNPLEQKENRDFGIQEFQNVKKRV